LQAGCSGFFKQLDWQIAFVSLCGCGGMQRVPKSSQEDSEHWQKYQPTPINKPHKQKTQQ
jgi:hypothetical protein